MISLMNNSFFLKKLLSSSILGSMMSVAHSLITSEKFGAILTFPVGLVLSEADESNMRGELEWLGELPL